VARSRIPLTAALTTLVAVGLPVATGVPAGAHPHRRADVHRVAGVAWTDAAPQLASGAVATADVTLAAGRPTSFRVAVDGGTLRTLPEGCEPSTVVRRHSYLDDARTGLRCEVAGRGALTVRVEVRAGDGSGGAGALALTVSEDGTATAAPTRPVVTAAADTPRRLRLISSPDFLNADVADLRRGPGAWTPKRSANGINAAYRKALDTVLDDWQAKDPAGVLVAGDLVNGRWGRDPRHTGTFGPVGTAAQRAEATRRAAATYYPQYLERFADHDLELYAAPGDHEYGDNPWTVSKRRLAPVFQQAFARYLTRDGAKPRFADRPSGPHAGTAYAFRPSPEVQVVSIDPFDITPGRARIRIDRDQLRWLRGVLSEARADGVRWTVVQGHVPILEPVRARGSSELRYPGGAQSALWRVMRAGGVDLYLTGEVHDVTASERDGIVQLAHGGAFQFGLTSYAVLDVHDDRLEITLDDYDVRTATPRGRRPLWETVRDGLRPSIRIDPTPFTIGTLTIGADGTLSDRSGILTAYRHGG
jgi:hypothetical protein